MLTVVSAAVQRGGRTWTGRHHQEIIRQMIEEGVETPIYVSEQGLRLSDGTFASRNRAARVAFAAKQVDHPLLSLLSEDLWK